MPGPTGSRCIIRLSCRPGKRCTRRTELLGHPHVPRGEGPPRRVVHGPRRSPRTRRAVGVGDRSGRRRNPPGMRGSGTASSTVTNRSGPRMPSRPGWPNAVFRGHAAALTRMQSLVDLVGPIEVHLDDLIDVPDGRFVASTIVGQEPTRLQSFAVVHMYNDLVIEADYYLDHAQDVASRGAVGMAMSQEHFEVMRRGYERFVATGEIRAIPISSGICPNSAGLASRSIRTEGREPIRRPNQGGCVGGIGCSSRPRSYIDAGGSSSSWPTSGGVRRPRYPHRHALCSGVVASGQDRRSGCGCWPTAWTRPRSP